MEKIENLWQTLFRKRGKKGVPTRSDGENKENVADNQQQGEQQDQLSVNPQAPQSQEYNCHPQQQQRPVDVRPERDVSHKGCETFPRGKLSAPASPKQQLKYREQYAVSTTSLRARRPDPYDRHMWASNQHFHIPLGAQRYQSSMPRWQSTSRAALSDGPSMELYRSHGRSRSPAAATTSQPACMRRPIEPSVSMQHFHVPTNRRKRMLYGRPGQKTAMTALVDELRARGPARARSPSMNNEEPIQLAHYPSGTPRPKPLEEPSHTEEQQTGADQLIDPLSQQEEDVKTDHDMSRHVDSDQDETDQHKLKKHEEELSKISSGIGRVFLETIRHTERIKTAKTANIDPRSAARTPGANKEPRYKLRYNSPAWASPSRDTMHARPWDSMEDLERPVVLSSSGCASGCASDHVPSVNSVAFTYRSSTPTPWSTSAGSHALHPTLASLPSVCRPGYTQFKSSTLPHMRNTADPSDRFSDDDLVSRPYENHTDTIKSDTAPLGNSVDIGGYNTLAGSVPTRSISGYNTPGANSHSGILFATNNNFSWLTLAKFQNEDTMRKDTSTKFFKRPHLKHNRTILDQ